MMEVIHPTQQSGEARTRADRYLKGGFGGLVHAGFQLRYLGTHTHHLHGARRLAEVAGQFDAYVRVVAETAGCPQLLDRHLRALDQGVLEAAAGVGLAQVGEGQGEGVGGKYKSGGEGGNAQHGAILLGKQIGRA